MFSPLISITRGNSCLNPLSLLVDGETSVVCGNGLIAALIYFY